jgi:quinate/shikimate dehydrogenase (NAD+)
MKLGLLGSGIGRSQAKQLHELIGMLLGRAVTYIPMDLEGQQNVSIATELARCEREGFAGVNVTHPYKRAAFFAVNRTVSQPHGLTAINTVVLSAGTTTGSNTDYSGFCRAYRAQYGRNCEPGRVLIAGAGGVGKAIAFALHNLGADELVIHDTRPAATAELLSELRACGQPARAAIDLTADMHAVDGLVNATPMGMFQYPGCAFPLRELQQPRWAFDAVYTPENTEFMAACRVRGVATLSGFKLFLYQGLDAWEHFTGIPAEAGLVERAFLERYPPADRLTASRH